MAKKTKQRVPGVSTQQGEIPTRNLPSAGSAPVFSILNFRTQAIILSIVGLVFYFNTFWHEAAFDDRMAVTDNEYVQRGVAGIHDILTKDAYQSYLEHKNGSNQLAGGRYRPLSLITFAIEQQVMGTVTENEEGIAKEERTANEMHTRHVVNVLLYILSVVVLLYFLHTIVFPDKPVVAFLAALIFTIHPIHTEVVANVKSRDEILSVLFTCLTFIKAFRYKETLKIRDLVIATIFLFLALLSKEYAVTLVVLIPLSFYFFKNEPLGYSFKTTLPYLIPVGVYLLLRYNAVTAAAAGAEQNVMNNPYLYASAAQKLASEILVLLDYLKLLIYPGSLVSDYSYKQIPYCDFSNLLVWVSILVNCVLVGLMVVFMKKRNVLGFAIAFYLVNLALVSNIFFSIGAPMGERLIYHSSLGFAIGVAYLLYTGFEQLRSPVKLKYGIGVIAAVLVVASGFKTIQRNADWKNDTALFLADVKKSPNSVLVNNNAAAACMSIAKLNQKDATIRNEWLAKAISYFDKALALYPKYTQARMNRGLCYFNMGNPDKAIPDWDTVRRDNPAQQNLAKYMNIAGKYYYNQGMKFRSANKIDSAIAAFGKSVNAEPRAADAWLELGKAYYAAGAYQEAYEPLNRAVMLSPNIQDAARLLEQIKAMPGLHAPEIK
jgi:protein O-mannosyl-transferase